MEMNKRRTSVAFGGKKRRKRRSLLARTVKIAIEETKDVRNKIWAVDFLEMLWTLVPDSTLRRIEETFTGAEQPSEVRLVAASFLTCCRPNSPQYFLRYAEMALSASLPSVSFVVLQVAAFLAGNNNNNNNDEIDDNNNDEIFTKIEKLGRRLWELDENAEAGNRNPQPPLQEPRLELRMRQQQQQQQQPFPKNNVKASTFISRQNSKFPVKTKDPRFQSTIAALCHLSVATAKLCFEINCSFKSAAFAAFGILLAGASRRRRRSAAYLAARALIFAGMSREAVERLGGGRGGGGRGGGGRGERGRVDGEKEEREEEGKEEREEEGEEEEMGRGRGGGGRGGERGGGGRGERGRVDGEREEREEEGEEEEEEMGGGRGGGGRGEVEKWKLFSLTKTQRKKLMEFEKQSRGHYDWPAINRRCLADPDCSFVLNEFFAEGLRATLVDGKGIGLRTDKRLTRGQLVHVGRPVVLVEEVDVGTEDSPSSSPSPSPSSSSLADESQRALARRLASLCNANADWRHRISFLATGEAARDGARRPPTMDELEGKPPIYLPHLPQQFLRLQSLLFYFSPLPPPPTPQPPPPQPTPTPLSSPSPQSSSSFPLPWQPRMTFEESLSMVLVSGFDARSIWHVRGDDDDDDDDDDPLESLVDKTGQWLLPSLFNHAFKPNLVWTIVGNNYVVRASRDVEPGEELLICYFLPDKLKDRAAYSSWKGIPSEIPLPLRRKREVVDEELEAAIRLKADARSKLREALKRLRDLRRNFFSEVEEDFTSALLWRHEAEICAGLGKTRRSVESLAKSAEIEAKTFSSPNVVRSLSRWTKAFESWRRWRLDGGNLPSRVLTNHFGLEE